MPILEKTFSKDFYKAIYSVDEIHDNYRLDQYLQLYLSNFSRENIKKKIIDGEIKIKGRNHSLRPSTKVHYKEAISMVIPKTIHEDEYWNGLKLELMETPDIIFEDKDLLVISKPPFMSTHPTGKHLFNCATVYFESILGHTCHSIHRLDRETSGVLLLGKNPTISSVLTPQFEEGKVKKCYFFIAKIKGPIQKEFKSFERLGTNEIGLKRVYINHYPKDSTLGKRAETKFKVIHTEGDYCLGLAFPQTGRQHQIRVHAKVSNLPLVGDKLYLGSFETFQRFKDNKASMEDHNLMELPRHALHSIGLNINCGKERKTFIAPIPEDLKQWISEKLSINTRDLEQSLASEIKEYFS